MKKIIPSVLICLLVVSIAASAQRKNINKSEVPAEVIAVLNQYLNILSTSGSLEECARRLTPICAGHLISQSGNKISYDVLSFSLKKDYQNVKFYRVPALIITDGDVVGTPGLVVGGFVVGSASTIGETTAVHITFGLLVGGFVVGARGYADDPDGPWFPIIGRSAFV